ncbi:MAG: deoxyribodipyrimidine photo-lyase [Bdellovibrio sp.]|nr:deoxyribodipyrimidine photo-lyase [Bdellovibrio sp.]
MVTTKQKLTLFWFRRDLRFDDNAGLYHALCNHQAVLAFFIFDDNILKHLPKKDARVLFIHQSIADLKEKFQEMGSDLLVKHGNPLEIIKQLTEEFLVDAIYTNTDYEPEAIKRDDKVKKHCEEKLIQFLSYKDQVIFEKKEIVTDLQKPYTVYTPYKKKWLAALSPFYLKPHPNKEYKKNLHQVKKTTALVSLGELGFESFEFDFPKPEVSTKILKEYGEKRDFPAMNATSHLGLHLRFGTVSVRELAREAKAQNSDVWLSELVWRDFFMQIVWNFPHVEKSSFRPQFDTVAWRKDKAEFKKWTLGQTGYPMVDAGMRELNATGFMHNRVRMVTASFLTKHLLMYWYEGERYFAEKLLDYDLAANNGNWQWSAGTGCDAAPYFRIFNPTSQLERFDKDLKYIKKWVPEYGTDQYVKPMVEHTFARERALTEFKRALK